MYDLTAFRFQWLDAWNSFGIGYRSELVLGTEHVSLDFLVDKKTFSIDLTGRVDEFIRDILECGIENWNENCYEDPWVCDGKGWHLFFSYNGNDIFSKGYNGYPVGYDSFLEVLHCKWGLPYSEYCDGKDFSVKSYLKRTKIYHFVPISFY